MPEQDSDTLRLTAWLADRDEPCPRCGYSLRGLEPKPVGEHRCPECDLLLEMRLAGSVTTPGPWLFAFAAVAMGLGFDAVMGLMLFVVMLISGGAGGVEQFVMLLMFAVLGVLGLLVLHRLSLKRHTWLRWAKDRQTRAATGVFLGVFFGHLGTAGLFFLWVMSR